MPQIDGAGTQCSSCNEGTLQTTYLEGTLLQAKKLLATFLTPTSALKSVYENTVLNENFDALKSHQLKCDHCGAYGAKCLHCGHVSVWDKRMPGSSSVTCESCQQVFLVGGDG